MELRHQHPWLVADLEGPHAVASWAIVGGGLKQAEQIVWLQVRDEELGPDVDPVGFIEERLTEFGFKHTVCMLTSSGLIHHQHTLREISETTAQVVTTVGLSNRLTVGDPPMSGILGTINVLVVVNRSLSPAAMLEAMSIAVEARTAAMISLQTRSTAGPSLATGTGTDCVVIAAPLNNGQQPALYAGKHTALGAVIGQAVLDAVSAGGKAWMERNL